MGWFKITRIGPEPKVVYDSRLEELTDETQKYLLEWQGFIDRATDTDVKQKAIMLREHAVMREFNDERGRGFGISAPGDEQRGFIPQIDERPHRK